MSGKEPIRVVIADDQAIVRSGLGAFVMAYDELRLIGEAGDGEEAVQLCELTQPDVVLMDLKMPKMDGIAATRAIRQRWPHIQVLVLTSFKEKDMVNGALEAGAKGYLLKNITADELAQAIRQVHQGHKLIAQEAAEAVVRSEHIGMLESKLQGADLNLNKMSEILRKHIPQIFPDGLCQVRLFPDQDIFSHPTPPSQPLEEAAWRWLHTSDDLKLFSLGEAFPWGGKQIPGMSLILAPILDEAGREAFGGISLLQKGYPDDLEDLVPVVKSLAGILSTAISKIQARSSQPAGNSANQELAMAGKIQAGILPDKPPSIRGWEFSTKLIPARETSGDFFDYIPLANGKWGIVIADVTDKGFGAAVFMAMCSSLIRTYAGRYPTLPAIALRSVNERILSDTRGSLFVTAFYGVLEPEIGRMRYVNAGHNPPYLLSTQRGKPVDRLAGTGMALGVSAEAVWQQKIIKFSPGDTLVLYTDGITEAHNHFGMLFGEQRLLDVIRSKMGYRPQDIQEAILAEVDKFVRGTPMQDDVTLMVMTRKTG
jgi:DNA-binding NarL/FixJ family response regulator